VHDVDAMKVSNSLDDLFEHSSGCDLAALAVWFLPYVLLERDSLDVICHEMHLFWGVD